MKFITLVVFLAVLTPAISQNEFSYSRSDKKAIERAKVRKEEAVNSLDRKKLYDLGVFYERIFDKYKDTSMKSAVNCFMLACYTEGDWLHDFQPKAAFRVGNAYEKGKGLPKDLVRAMGWYQYSTNEGKRRFNKLQSDACDKPSGEVSMTGEKRSDANVFNFSVSVNPYCADVSKSSGLALSTIAGLMKNDPLSQLEVSIVPPANIDIPFYYVMFPSTVSLRMNSIINYMDEKEGISGERIIQKDLEDKTGSGQEIAIYFRLTTSIPKQSVQR